MKYIILYILLLITGFSYSQQFKYSKYGEPIPFSHYEENKQFINFNNINSINLGEYDNDSLCMVKNGCLLEDLSGRTNSYGIKIDTSFNLLETATKVKLPEGTLYLLIIESRTAGSMLMPIVLDEISEGCYLATYTDSSLYAKILPLEQTMVFTHDDYLDYYGRRNDLPLACDGASRLYIEYYQPDSMEEGKKMIVPHIMYGFIGGVKKK